MFTTCLYPNNLLSTGIVTFAIWTGDVCFMILFWGPPCTHWKELKAKFISVSPQIPEHLMSEGVAEIKRKKSSFVLFLKWLILSLTAFTFQLNITLMLFVCYMYLLVFSPEMCMPVYTGEVVNWVWDLKSFPCLFKVRNVTITWMVLWEQTTEKFSLCLSYCYY